MNKCDLLQRKLKSGVKVKRYMTSYGERENDFVTFSGCMRLIVFNCRSPSVSVSFVDLRHKFKDILEAHSPERRTFYGFTTSVVVSGSSPGCTTVV